MECEDCKLVKDDVEETTCPFADEIYDTKIPATLCRDCYHERCMDI